ncbi:MAG: CNNM domain-containing protein [Candidatus Saccharibacteria bacterium]
MADYIYSLILLIIALVCIELRKSYHAVPKAELKRQAKAGDVLADKIYHAVSYEESLETLLWILIILCAAGSLILFNRVAPLWLDFIAIVLFIWVAFAWLPKRRMDRFSLRLASILSPVIVWLLNYLHPLFQKVNHFGSKAITVHTGVYDKKDLIKLVEAQKKQADNRLSLRTWILLEKDLNCQIKRLETTTLAGRRFTIL